jgi:hypothetical protein
MSPFGRMRAALLAFLSIFAICASMAGVANAYSKDQNTVRAKARAGCKHRNSRNTCILSSSTPCVYYKRKTEKDNEGWVRARCLTAVRDTAKAPLRGEVWIFYW